MSELSQFAPECHSWIQENDLTVVSFLQFNLEPILSPEIILEPGTATLVACNLDKSDLPPVPVTQTTINFLNASTRSCLAQAGLELGNPRGNLVISAEQADTLNNDGIYSLVLPLRNLGPSHLIMKTGDRVGRLYYANDVDQITGDDLLLTSSNLIDGEYDEDWWLVTGKTAKNAVSDCKAIALVIDSDKRYYLPADTPIRIAGRDDIYQNARLVDSDTPVHIRTHPFILAQTRAPVRLPKDIMGELSYATGLTPNGIKQTNSRLIDPGTDHRIRVELSTEHSTGGVEVVLMRLLGNVLTKTVLDRTTYPESLK